MQVIFRGSIKKGKLILDDPARFAVHLSSLNDKRVEVVVRKEKSQRSLNQNSAYWGIVVEILSEHLGYDRENTHDALRTKFLSRVDPSTGLTVIRSTASLSTVEFMEYYEAIQRWASEFLNCQIPSPNEPDFGTMTYD
jgi:hypothetical protein